MDNTDVSPQYNSTSLGVTSPTASHIACLSGARLQLRCLSTFELVRSIKLPAAHRSRNARVVWSPPTTSHHISTSSVSTPPRRAPPSQSNRILVADDDTTRVYDVRDESWNAVINNGSGGTGKNVHVEFGANEDQVLVWSDFAACLKVWCLKTGRQVEIRDPKFSGKDGRGWGYRPSGTSKHGRGQVLALLCRSAGIDVLLLLSAQLPTSDAANLKWSRDGRWLAIWDAASTGYNLHIYTADGHLYRTITREPAEEVGTWGIEGMGIKSVDWLPGNEKLAVGGWDRRVRILSTRTFAPVVFLDHTATIHIPDAPVYTEHLDGQGNRSYVLTPQPAIPPKAPVEKNETALMKQGISILKFNADGTLCATRDDSTPSTVWIWDLQSLRPRIVLIQYSPIKTLDWHPHDPTRLLIHTAHDSPTVYLYTTQSLSSSSSSLSSPQHHPPDILDLSPHITKPVTPLIPKWSSSWLSTAPDKKPVFLQGHQQAYILVWPAGKDQILRFDNDDAEQSDDNILPSSYLRETCI
ncbi:hypothetical protein GQ44DRAFT_746315 [Phaeosphaeriaceae sp. PMI808]|nr:hypothetical protein GQ44DRAFT_746315 [Phaeosphaeriaceae sp. PMI808]